LDRIADPFQKDKIHKARIVDRVNTSRKERGQRNGVEKTEGTSSEEGGARSQCRNGRGEKKTLQRVKKENSIKLSAQKGGRGGQEKKGDLVRNLGRENAKS